jgi:protein phosphatase
MKFNYTSYSIKGKRKKSNLDYIHTQEFDNEWLGIACDGVGDEGESVNPGKLCAEKLAEILENHSEKDHLKKVKSAIELTNNFLHTLNESDQSGKKSATTLVLLYISNHTAYWGHVGDSRIYKLKNGRLNLLTKDHSVIQQLIDKGFLTLKEAFSHSGTNVIGRAIGEKSNVMSDVSKMNLHPFDKNRFFLCTDGITQILSDNEIEKCLGQSNVQECSQELINLIYKYDVPDDTSFIIIDAF